MSSQTDPLPSAKTSSDQRVGLPWIAIAAMAGNRVIGNANRIPWHLPEDFKWFKETTMGGTLVMGRKTFESIGRPLPGRTTVVLSRGGFQDPRVVTVSSLEELRKVTLPEPVFICGGAEIYTQALPHCRTLLLTRVRMSPPGDALFPAFETEFRLDAVLRETPEFTIERWIRAR